MRNLLALVGLAVIGFGGVGWYMGWYKLSYARTPEGNLLINTTVNTHKAETDTSEFIKNAGAVVGGQVDKAGQDAKTATAPNTPPGNIPGPAVPPQLSPNPTVPGTLPAPAAPGPIQLKAPRQ